MAGRALNDEEVAQEMRKMTEFIRQEANEKAREIQVKADEEHNIEKAKLVRQETLNLEAAYQKKMKQLQVQRKIAQSTHINKSRLRVLQTREEMLTQLLGEAKKRLTTIATDQRRYGELLKGFLLQAFYQLHEPEMTVYCRKQDVPLVQSALEDAKTKYTSTTHLPLTVTLSQQQYLPEAISGGVVVTALQGKIQCNNTLDARLDLSAEKLLPVIRTMLIGVTPSRRFFD